MNLEKKTVVELKAIAKKKGLTGYSILRKADLIKFIKEEGKSKVSRKRSRRSRDRRTSRRRDRSRKRRSRRRERKYRRSRKSRSRKLSSGRKVTLDTFIKNHLTNSCVNLKPKKEAINKIKDVVLRQVERVLIKADSYREQRVFGQGGLNTIYDFDITKALPKTLKGELGTIAAREVKNIKTTKINLTYAKNIVKNQYVSPNISKEALIALTVVIEYLAGEIAEVTRLLVTDEMASDKIKRSNIITEKDVVKEMSVDDELKYLL